jgi:hypothetical protein
MRGGKGARVIAPADGLGVPSVGNGVPGRPGNVVGANVLFVPAITTEIVVISTKANMLLESLMLSVVFALFDELFDRRFEIERKEK